MNYGRNEQGTATITTAGSSDVIATPGASHRLVIQHVVVSCFVTVASATLALTDGTTTYWKVSVADTDGGVSWNIDFGEKGYPLPKNKALVFTIAGGEADGIATATGYVRGRA